MLCYGVLCRAYNMKVKHLITVNIILTVIMIPFYGVFTNPTMVSFWISS